MKTSPIFALVCLLLTACGTPNYHFRPYVGQQENWATAPGGYVHRIEGIDIYSNLPIRHYEIVGAVEVNSEKALARAVKFYKADAALISRHQLVSNGAVIFPGEIVPLTRQVITANLIRFKE